MDLRARLEVAVGGAQYRLVVRAAARALGFTEDAAVVDGVRVPFFARGFGVPLVLVHGFGGDKESWLILALAIARRRSVIIPDLPGFGAAGAIPPERASAKHQARTLAGLLDALGYARAHLVGNSMGGGISLRFAHDFAARATSLTLIGSVGPVVEKSEVIRAIDRGENPLVMHHLEDLDRMLKLVSERPPPLPRAMRRYIATDRFARREAQMALFEGWSNPRPEEGFARVKLEEIDTPTLVIHGARDRVIDPSTGRALAARLPNAQLELLEGVGHVPQMEAPLRVARSIESFADRAEAHWRRRGTGHAA